MCTTSHRHSIFCILPPHVLRSIVERGTPEQRQMAVNTLSLDATLRAFRASARSFEAAPSVDALAAPAEKRCTVYDAEHSQQLPGRRVRGEGDPPSADVAVNEAFDGLTNTWNFFWNVYGRNSIDDEGMALDATVHFGNRYNNAFWNSQQMVFGDGDGRLFNRFTIALDIIGHELGHGVTEDEAGLAYLFQPGALNESMSDVFGSLVKQSRGNQTADAADWLIGEGLLAGGRAGGCPPLHEGAWNGLRRSGARQGSAAGTHGRLRPNLRGQRGSAHQLRHSRIARSTSRPRGSADTPGREPVASGTRRCATHG